MDIFGIGLPEIAFILLLVVIIFGPKDLEKMAKTLGSTLGRFVRSDTIRNLRRIGELPSEFARKAGLDEFRATATSTKITDPGKLPEGRIIPAESPNPEKSEPENRIEPPAQGAGNPK
jgi:sec-independent protein translocase protein TatA